MAKDMWDKIYGFGEKAMNITYKEGERRGIQAYKTGEKIGTSVLKKWAAMDPLSKHLHIPQKVTLAVFERDGRKCKACGGAGKQKCKVCGQVLGRLELDHKIPIKAIEDQPLNPFIRSEVNNPNNYQTLCRHHNRIKSGKYPCDLKRLGNCDECQK